MLTRSILPVTLACLLLVSCKTTDQNPPIGRYTQVVKNETIYPVSIKSYDRIPGKTAQYIKEYRIASNDSLVIKYREVDLKFEPFYSEGRPDSVAILFGSEYLLLDYTCLNGSTDCTKD